MSQTLPNDPNIERVYEIAKDWIQENEAPSVSNIVPFATNLMSAAQKIVTERGRGAYKARIVMTVARKIVREAKYENDADRQAAIDLVETMLPSALTAIKMASQALIPMVQPRCC
jgi:hypothetical protein